MKDHTRFVKLVASIILGLLLILVMSLAFSSVMATTTDGDYAIILGSPNAPAAARAAPYGQWIITHNSVAGITTTANYGTVARTNGYDQFKNVICYNSGAYTATVNLYLRTTSTGDLYSLAVPLTTVNPASRKVISLTQTAPWMSLGITSTDATTGTTMLCGIYVQTP